VRRRKPKESKDAAPGRIGRNRPLKPKGGHTKGRRAIASWVEDKKAVKRFERPVSRGKEFARCEGK